MRHKKAGGARVPTVISLNPQLPPDLQQQQINPLTLPGFSLPQGQNGLFRLSGQAAQSSVASTAQTSAGDRTLSGRSIALGQREQSLSHTATQGRSLAIATHGGLAAGQVEGSAWSLGNSGGSLLASGTTGAVDSGGAAAPVALSGQVLSGALALPGSTEQIQRSAGNVASITAVSGQQVSLGNSENNAGVPQVVPSANQAQLAIAPPVAQLVAQVQGLPSSATPTNSHKYLIETNPELTNLKQFLSSDYMLGNLGYDSDQAQKRLGDGLYEQRLVREAVVARTGQRFLNGLTSDEAMFRYLMNNAIASKQALNLSLGVTLTAAQVAALTHDIVWLEEYEVNGEKVLVPVLYLAQANNRLGPNGALIQGKDVSLISGGELNNSGTLRAGNNLSARAGGDLANTGLIEAGNRLDLLADKNLTNTRGGIIAGRDVSLTAVTGDLLNQRNVTRHEVNYAGQQRTQDYVDSASRIEAANSLSLKAGRDVVNLGAVFDSKGDLSIDAGRDVTIASVEERTRQARGSAYLNEHVTQLGAEVNAGRDIQINAGRDISAIASQIDARRDIALSAAGDVTLAAAANEDHFASRSKKVTQETRSLKQQATELGAGRDISISAGQDLTVLGSQVKAEHNVALDAEQDINILSAKDESSSYYFRKKKGSFGRSSSTQSESYNSTNVASVIKAGNDLTINASQSADGSMSLNGGRDVSVIGSQLKAGNDLLVGATGDVAVLSGVEEHGSYSKKTKSGFLGLSKSGKSQLQTTATQVASELDAGNDLVIAAGNDIRLRASEATAGNDVELRAGLVNDTGDINLVSANDTAYSLSEQYKKKVGLSTSGGFLSVSSAKKAGREAQSSTTVGSQVVADRDAKLQAERDINVVGSGISAGGNVSLDAGRDVNVVAAQDTSTQRNWEKNKQVGIGVSGDANGVNFFIGAERSQEKDRQQRETAAASQISAGQDVSVQAGRDINQRGSDLQAERDINLRATRDINLDAARETFVQEESDRRERTGLTVNVSHNYGNTKDAVGGAGKGDNGVSKGSSALQAVDAVRQFVSGPTIAVHLGSASQETSSRQETRSNRASTLDAGRDINAVAGDGLTVSGSQLHAGRDISLAGKDVTLDVARGAATNENKESRGQGGINGGTAGGFKVGIGGSRGEAIEEQTRGTSLPTQLQAGRDIDLKATNDLTLIGTQTKAERDIKLNAGNDLTIRAAGNEFDEESTRRSGGGEVGIAVGQQGIGVYASVSMGKGQLEREGDRQQEAYLYAGDRLSFTSGKDTTIAGAELRGDEVIGRVGGDLSVSSVPDTGKVKGKEFDISATVTVGAGVSVSGSVGYGKTTGKTNWIEEQTSITAKDRLDIRTENHTQLDGALLASDSGNLKLDTGTLGFRDIKGEDKEHGYYLNVGGSYGFSSGETGQATGTSIVQDPSQVGKGKKGESGWSVSGYDYRKERDQIVRATVGAGDVVVRNDAETSNDSTAGLNRDLSQAYEVTKDEEERTDLYASSSSVDAVSHPVETYEQWEQSVERYGESSEEALANVGKLIIAGSSLAEGKSLEEIQRHLRVVEVLRQLNKGDAQQRASAARGLVGVITENAGGAENQAVADRVAQLAEQDPTKAQQTLALLAKLQHPQNGVQQNFGPLLLGVPVVEALGVVLLSAAATSGNQQNLSEAANSLMEATAKTGANAREQVRLSAELWALVVGTAFPIHTLDPKYGPLVNPIVDPLSGNDVAGGGYGADGRVELPTHTGGSQLDGPQGGTSYTNPEHQLPSGNMYSEGSLPNGKTVDSFERGLVKLPPGERVAEVKKTAQEVAVSYGWKKDSKLSRTNGRDVYVSQSGGLYAVDTQHGRFEVVNGKTGAHMGEVKFNLESVPGSKDYSGGHDLKVK
nr:hemagglutinin repeat-containing protein [Pseudomonas cavernicola]